MYVFQRLHEKPDYSKPVKLHSAAARSKTLTVYFGHARVALRQRNLKLMANIFKLFLPEYKMNPVDLKRSPKLLPKYLVNNSVLFSVKSSTNDFGLRQHNLSYIRQVYSNKRIVYYNEVWLMRRACVSWVGGVAAGPGPSCKASAPLWLRRVVSPASQIPDRVRRKKNA